MRLVVTTAAPLASTAEPSTLDVVLSVSVTVPVGRTPPPEAAMVTLKVVVAPLAISAEAARSTGATVALTTVTLALAFDVPKELSPE